MAQSNTGARRKRRRKKINLSRMLLACIILILVLVFGISAKTVVDLHMEKSRLQKENARLLKEKAQMEKELERVNDLTYIEEQARKQLNMVKPGEIVYITDDEEEDK